MSRFFYKRYNTRLILTDENNLIKVVMVLMRKGNEYYASKDETVEFYIEKILEYTTKTDPFMRIITGKSRYKIKNVKETVFKFEHSQDAAKSENVYVHQYGQYVTIFVSVYPFLIISKKEKAKEVITRYISNIIEEYREHEPIDTITTIIVNKYIPSAFIAESTLRWIQNLLPIKIPLETEEIERVRKALNSEQYLDFIKEQIAEHIPTDLTEFREVNELTPPIYMIGEKMLHFYEYGEKSFRNMHIPDDISNKNALKQFFNNPNHSLFSNTIYYDAIYDIIMMNRQISDKEKMKQKLEEEQLTMQTKMKILQIAV